MHVAAITPARLWIAAALAVVLAAVTWQRCGFEGCPDVAALAAYQPGEAPELLDHQGQQFALLTPVPRQIVALDSLPEFVGDAFIAVEDKRFMEHHGVDWRRVVGALVADIKAGGAVQGSSTLTMQLARSAFPERLPAAERTLRRKMMEVRVARAIERHFDKREILELYLNHIYLGGGTYGVEAASHYYFDHPASELTLAEAALLAALPRGPAVYDPRRYPDRARARRDLVLRLMAEQGMIPPDRLAEATSARLGVTKEPRVAGATPGFAPYFVEAVRSILENRFGDALYTSHLRIRTTLDRAAQKAAEEELGAQLRRIERGVYGRFKGDRFDASEGVRASGSAYLQGAVVAMSAETGDVLALVGGRDWAHSRFDRAVQGRRQAGSAFKPFVYVAALAEGYAPSQPIADEPFRLALGGGRTWTPRDFDGEFDGLMTLREALAESRNVPAARLAAAVGVDEVADVARAAGIHSPIPSQPSMALGTASVSPLELTAAYTAFAAGGEAAAPRFIRRVEDRNGAVLWTPAMERHRALDPAVAYILTNMLTDVVDYGTGHAVRSVGFAGPAAGKTGTTTDGNDVWFVGYTPDVVTGVWIGFDQPRPIIRNATGGGLAAPVWGRIMKRVYSGSREPGRWRRPAGVVVRTVDPATGLVLEEDCGPREVEAEPYREVFLAGAVPLEVCPRRGGERGWLANLLGALAHGLGIDRSADPAYTEYDELYRTLDQPRTEEEKLLGARRLPLQSEGRRVEVRSDQRRSG